MTERVIGSTESPRRRRTLLLPLIAVIALGLIFTAGASADLSRTLFELDKDATNNATYTKIGLLNAAVSADTTVPLETTIQICQDVSAFYNGAKILIDAERMTLANGANLGGGGCPSGFDFKRSYLATRGVDGTSAGPAPNGDHAKAENISKIDTGTTGVFEGDDWNQVYDLANGDPDETCTSLGAVECVFSHDGRSTSIFTSSKDYDEISGTPAHWQWRDQSVPDANELDDGFAIKYIDGTGDQQLYFGADRFATEGTKDAGFWFFQKPIAPVPGVGGADGTFTGTHTAPDDGGDGFCNPASGGVGGGPTQTSPNCPGTGAHYDNNDTGGDVLVLTSFSNGGATVTVRVFEWIGPGGSTASLLQRGVQGDCVPGASTQELCATVNNTTVESEWSYDGKGEPVDDEISAGGLLEGGINLSDLNLEGCFSSFMATTRSSDTLTADPKDWILGDFESCDSDLTTTPMTGATPPGALIPDSDNDNLDEISIGAGSVAVKDSALLSVTGESNFTGTLSFYLCGPIANPNPCSTSGVNAGFAGNPVTANGTYNSNSVTLTSTGRYCWFAFFDSGTEGVPDADDGTIESADGTGECFEVMPVTPTLATCSGTYNASNVCTPSSPVPFGSAVSDRALLSGLAKEAGSNGATNGGNATYPTIRATNGAFAGEIEFTLKGPAATGCGVTAASSTGNENPQSVNVDTVTGNKVYGPVSYTPASSGRYSWQAQWRYATGSVPSSPNNVSPVTHNASCDDANEDVTVQQVPSQIATGPFTYPQDSASIKSSVAGDNLPAGGTVEFKLFGAAGGNTANANCLTNNGTGLVFSETKTGVVPAGGANEVTGIMTNNQSFSIDSTKNGTYFWRVTYTPGAQTHTGRASVCVESTAVTQTDAAYPGTLHPPAP